MKKILVSYYEHFVYRGDGSPPHKLYLTFPDYGMGHHLMICMNCGEIYAVDICKELYCNESLQDRLDISSCASCNSSLSETCRPYPNTYLYDGQVFQFDPPTIYPDNEESFLIEFYSLYE